MRAYLKTLALTALCSAAAIGAFQASVDASGVLGTRLVPASLLPPIWRSDVGGADRAVKALELARRKDPLDALFLGSSRVQFAFDPKAFPQIRTYNGAVRGARMAEDADILFYALDRGPTFRRVVWGHDFWEFFGDEYKPGDPASPFVEPRPAQTVLRLLFSYDMVRRSANALGAGLSGRLKPVFETDGFYRVENAPVYGAVDFPDLPQLRNWFDPSLATGREAFRLNLRRGLDAFVDAASAAKARGIDVDLVLPPEHVARLGLYRALGLWDDFVFWKQEVANALARVEAASGPGRARGFDFNDAGELAQTPFPPERYASPVFFETLHAKPAVAKKIMARLMDWPEADPDFGRPLPQSLEKAQDWRKALEFWLAANPQASAEIDEVAARGAAPAP